MLVGIFFFFDWFKIFCIFKFFFIFVKFFNEDSEVFIFFFCVRVVLKLFCVGCFVGLICGFVVDFELEFVGFWLKDIES